MPRDQQLAPRDDDPVQDLQTTAERMGNNRQHFMAEIPLRIFQSPEDARFSFMQRSDVQAETIGDYVSILCSKGGIFSHEEHPEDSTPASRMFMTPDYASRLAIADGLMGLSVDGKGFIAHTEVAKDVVRAGRAANRRRMRRETYMESQDDDGSGESY
jgi:hypothetical protein